MSSLLAAGPPRPLGVPQMPQLPHAEDYEATWRYVETGINHILLEPTFDVDMRSLMGWYTAVYNYCTSQKTLERLPKKSSSLPGRDLYEHLIECLCQYLSELKQRSKSYSEEALLKFYIEEWAHYARSAKYIDHIFDYLNRHWITREIDEGKDIYDVYTLHLVQWLRKLVEEISGDVREAILKLVENYLKGETTESSEIETVINSFFSLGLDNPDLPNSVVDIYRYHFEKSLIEDIKASCQAQCRSGNSIADYEKAISLLERKGQRVSLDLAPEIKPRLTKECKNTSVMLKLATSDCTVIEVERQVVECSLVLKRFLEDIGYEAVGNEPIPLPKVNDTILRKVLEWCEHHKNDPITTDNYCHDTHSKTTDIEEWDRKFMQIDQEMLFEIIIAANYLNIKPLMDLGSKTIADMIKGADPRDIRKMFNITNTFTPEEEEMIRRENEWAEDR